MILIAPAVLGVPARGGRRLITDPALPAYVALLRSHAAARATALDADDTSWSEFAADLPRFHGAARRLLVEGARTNAVRNPRAEGATAGSPGTLPTYWGLNGLPSGIASTVVGTMIVGGVHCLRLRLAGTPATSATARLEPEGLSSIAAANGQSWTSSLFIGLHAGSLANLVATYRLMGRDGSYSAYNMVTAALSPSASLGRSTLTTTIASASVVTATTDITFGFTSGQAVDCTLNIGWPQMEQGPYASTPILPAVGSPASSTRGADLLSAALASVGVGSNGACTLLFWGVLPQAAGAAADQLLLSLDDGTASNRFRLLNPAGGSALQIGRSLAGASAAATAGSITPGMAFKAGVSVDGAGRAAASLNGAAVVAQSGGPTSGLTTLRIGNDAGNTAACFGLAAECRVLPYAVADSALPGLVTALPG